MHQHFQKSKQDSHMQKYNIAPRKKWKFCVNVKEAKGLQTTNYNHIVYQGSLYCIVFSIRLVTKE